MKISVVHSFYRSEMPSGENIVVNLQSEALWNAGHDVQLVAVRTDDLLTRPFYEMSSAIRVATDFGQNPLKQINSFQPDIVHVHNLFPNWTTSWIRQLRVPVVATIHNYRPLCAAGTLTRNGKPCELCPTKGSQNAVFHRCYGNGAVSSIPLAVATRRNSPRRVVSDTDALVFLSQRAKDTYSRLTSLPLRNEIIPNFVSPQSEKTELVSSSLQKNFRGRFWVFSGRLTEEKGLLELLEVWPKSERLVVVGSGPQEAACREKSARKHVDFLGSLSQRETQQIVRSAQGLVFPSRWPEPAAALSYLEALSEGVPSIAIRGNGVSDDISGHQTGVVVQNVEAFPKGLDELTRERAYLSRHAIKRFRARYTTEAWLSDIERLYESLR